MFDRDHDLRPGPGDPPALGEPLLVLIPVFDDWEALGALLDDLDRTLDADGLEAGVLVVDDGSTAEPAVDPTAVDRRALRHVDVLRLRRNVGHQRAIAIGLAYAEDRGSCRAVVVMDGDGEDAPADVPRLLAKYREERGRKIVFAERARRSESPAFRAFYALYKAAHLLLTGVAVRVGNFSVIPRERLASLVVVSEMWNHYAAAAARSRQPSCTVPTERGRRIEGKSKMNLVALVVHGLGAISVYAEVVGVRLLAASAGLVVLSGALLGAIVFVRTATDLAIPGWATSAAGLLLMALFQGVMLALIFTFVILGGRAGSSFLPRRDYAHFIGRTISRPEGVPAGGFDGRAAGGPAGPYEDDPPGPTGRIKPPALVRPWPDGWRPRGPSGRSAW